jgi:ubiquinone biosynthesis protein UbiJ
MGRAASASLDVVETLVRHDPDDQVRELARNVASDIRNNTPLPAEVGRLREQLDRLRQSQEELKDRLERYENRAGKH